MSRIEKCGIKFNPYMENKRGNRKRKQRQYELRRMRRLSKRRKRVRHYKSRKKNKKEKEPGQLFQITAPSDFRLLTNTTECVNWFRLLRSLVLAAESPMGQKYQRIDLAGVEHIDFASTMVLGVICEELLEITPSCWCFGRLPKNPECAKYIKDSGFLNGMRDATGKPYSKSEGSESVKIQRGKTRLENEKVRSIVQIDRHACELLTGRNKVTYRHIDVIKEICGNAFVWSQAFNRQWVMGAKFENDKVVYVVLDLGKGILDTLARNYFDIIKDKLAQNSGVEILLGAFKRKYGSASEDDNRNRGLPFVEKTFKDGYIKDLSVLCNNVYLDFSDPTKNKIIAQDMHSAFDGTLYSWRIDASCFK